MPAAKVAPGLAEYANYAAGHIFAGVVACALDDRYRARIAHREAFARDAVEIGLACNRAIQHGVADNDILARVARSIRLAGAR